MSGDNGINKIKNLLGLARRANLLAIGQDQTLNAILAQKAVIIILSQDIGAAAKRKIEGKAKNASITVLTKGTREELGEAIGLASCSAIAVLDEGFAGLIINKDDRDQVED